MSERFHSVFSIATFLLIAVLVFVGVVIVPIFSIWSLFKLIKELKKKDN